MWAGGVVESKPGGDPSVGFATVGLAVEVDDAGAGAPGTLVKTSW